MNKVMSRSVILAGAVLFMGTPAMAAVTSGLIGDCVDCHTMHNSEQGAPVAMVGSSISADPIQNLLRMDCVACHADPTASARIVDMGGGSAIPQVNSTDTKDLAGGNFRYLNGGVNARKGHNVVDLGSPDTNGLDDTGLLTPPGMYHGETGDTHAGANRFTMGGGFLANFTCAGSAGCHGIRNRATATLNANLTTDSPGNTGGPGTAYYENPVRLTGIAAISGAHHNSEDGLKNPGVPASYTEVDGAFVAKSYRFIAGLAGMGNTTNDTDRWQNVSSTSHNEYAGADAAYTLGCGGCHKGGSSTIYANGHLEVDGYLAVPGESQSGFCVTCHGEFHSNGSTAGSSGAFLRHPADYVIPDSGEYSSYTNYSITAPVARQLTALIGMPGPSSSVDTSTGTDMVMCLSCHVAHASQYDGMLRFNYEKMQAGNAAAGDLETGCLACHTTKGILPAGR